MLYRRFQFFSFLANIKQVRNTFADYFVNKGQVYWQWEKS